MPYFEREEQMFMVNLAQETADKIGFAEYDHALIMKAILLLNREKIFHDYSGDYKKKLLDKTQSIKENR